MQNALEELVTIIPKDLYDTYAQSKKRLHIRELIKHISSNENYESWNQKWLIDSILRLNKKAKPSHRDASIIFYRKYWLNLCYYNGKWYRYENNGWIKSTIMEIVHFYIKADFIPYLESIKKVLEEDKRDANIKEDYDYSIVAIKALIEKLNSFGISMLKCAQHLFEQDYDPCA